MRGAANKIRRRRRDDDHLCFARQSDVVESVTGPEDLGMNRAPGDGLEGDGADKLAGAACHHDIYFSASLCKQTRQPH